MNSNQPLAVCAVTRREIEGRLENWGKWARISAPNAPSKCSPLYRLIRENNPGVISENTIRQYDETDAWLVEKAIERVCLHYQLKILKLRFIARLRPNVICRKVGIERYSFDKELDSIEKKLEIEFNKAYTRGTQKCPA